MAVSISISISQNEQSVTNNTSNVTVSVKASWTYGSWNANQKPGWVKIDGTTYNFTHSFNTGRSTSGSETLYSKTIDINHNNDGTKKLTCSASYTSGVSSGTVTASASKTLTTIPRKSDLSIGSSTSLGSSTTLTISRASSSFLHTLTASCGSYSTTLLSKSSSTSKSFVPPLEWASNNTTGTSITITYKLTTFTKDEVQIGYNTYSKTYYLPSSYKPSCSISVTDGTSCLSTYGKYVQGHSKFKVTVTGSPIYSSPISSYSAYANGTNYSVRSFTTDVIKSYGLHHVTAKVTDKRNRTSDQAEVDNIDVYQYNDPVITKLSVNRCNSNGVSDIQGAYVKVSYSGKVTPLNNKNSAIFTLRYKKSNQTDWETPIVLSTTVGVTTKVYTITDGYTDPIPVDTESSYNVELSLTDDFHSGSNAITKITSVSTAFSIIHFGSSGKSLAIGKLSEIANRFEVGIQSIFHDYVEFNAKSASSWVCAVFRKDGSGASAIRFANSSGNLGCIGMKGSEDNSSLYRWDSDGSYRHEIYDTENNKLITGTVTPPTSGVRNVSGYLARYPLSGQVILRLYFMTDKAYSAGNSITFTIDDEYKPTANWALSVDSTKRNTARAGSDGVIVTFREDCTSGYSVYIAGTWVI